jgi:hypothetical protein
MQIIAPDFLTDLRDLPLYATVTMALIGAGLWICGWWGHRFWMGLLTSFGAGLVGLRLGPDWGLDPLAAGIMLAVAGGSLALAICRIGVFLIYGVAAWHLMQALAPKASHPIACIAIGGALAVLIFRFSVILMTSAAGVWLAGHGGLLLAERFGKIDAPAWVTARPLWINTGFAATAFIGVIFQFWADNRLRRFLKARREVAQWVSRKQTPATGVANATQRGWLSRMKRAA